MATPRTKGTGASTNAALTGALCLLVGMSGGCAATDSSDDNTSRTQSAMVAGSPDTTHPAVVRIFNFRTNGTASGCSGTIVSPHVVLTAAHCAYPAILGELESVYVFHGQDATSKVVTDDKTKWVRAKTTRFNPNYGGATVAGNDVGVVITEDVLPVAPMRMHLAPLSVDEVRGKPLVGVGYGLATPADSKSHGYRTIRDVTVTGERPPDLFSFTNGTVCHGDSGGPLISQENGVDTVVGIIAFVGAAACNADNYATRVGMFADYVKGVVEEIDPGYLANGTPSAPTASDAGAPTLPNGDDSGNRAGATPTATQESGGCSAVRPPVAPATSLSFAVAALLVARRLRRPPSPKKETP